MKYSIITATKNDDDNLLKTIISVGGQIGVQHEHIIIDADSTDKSLTFINKYQAIYNIRFISEQDEGISDAFNKGIELAVGNWLIVLGAGDTFINPYVLKYVDKKLDLMNDYYVVWGNTLLINSNLKMQKRVNGLINKSKLKRYMCIPHQSSFYNRKLFDKYGKYNKKYKIAMDYDLILRAIDDIDMNGYVDFDVAFVLTGGVSSNVINVLKEYKTVQIDNLIARPVIICWLIYYWAICKYLASIVVMRIIGKPK